MPGLLSSVINHREEVAKKTFDTNQDLRDQIFEIAIRDFLGDAKESDTEELSQFMYVLDMSTDEYAAILKGISSVKNAVASVEYTSEKFDERQRDLKDAQRNWYLAKVEAQRCERRFNVLSQQGNPSQPLKTLSQLRSEFPTLFNEDGSSVNQLRPLIDQQKQESHAVDLAANEKVEADRIGTLNQVLKKFDLEQVAVEGSSVSKGPKANEVK